MKRLLFLLTFGLTLFSVPTFSQVDFADLEEGSKKGGFSDSAAKVIDTAVFDNAVYFKAGRSIPVGIYSQSPTLGKTTFDSFDGKDGTGAQPGFNAEVGFIYYFRKLKLPSRFRFGIDASLGFTKNKIVWANMPENYSLTYTIIFPSKYDNYNGSVGVKIGPVLSYRLFDKLIADIYFKLNPGFTNAPSINYYQQRKNEDGSTEYYYYQLSTTNNIIFRLQNSLGLNLRYSFLMAGLEYNYGRVGYSLNEQYGIRTRYSQETVTRTEKVSMPASKLLWTVGIKF